ncbi:hypothetical protein CMI47_03495 [Candidatus Pacearchaeota archaeon]|nr:hypothetical protein [Candidatus Pacearchaeota archaeon]|tara:strand:- start:60 stop:404 length:345 start_codon:yes stop_codon:yes gene_type:complete
MEKDIDKIPKNPDTDIVIRVDDFGGKRGVTIREFVKGERYTGFTKSGTRIPAEYFKQFKEAINSIDEAELAQPVEGADNSNGSSGQSGSEGAESSGQGGEAKSGEGSDIKEEAM